MVNFDKTIRNIIGDKKSKNMAQRGHKDVYFVKTGGDYILNPSNDFPMHYPTEAKARRDAKNNLTNYGEEKRKVKKSEYKVIKRMIPHEVEDILD
jgi:hypothetical protein